MWGIIHMGLVCLLGTLTRAMKVFWPPQTPGRAGDVLLEQANIEPVPFQTGM